MAEAATVGECLLFADTVEKAVKYSLWGGKLAVFPENGWKGCFGGSLGRPPGVMPPAFAEAY